MLNKIVMPPGGQTTNESQITRWLKRVGEHVKRGDILFEVETDKATLEVESYCEGTVLQIYYNEGDSVETGTVVAYIGDVADLKLLQAEKTIDKPVDQTPPIVEQGESDDDYVFITESHSQNDIIDISAHKQHDSEKQDVPKKLASPAAKKAAKEYNVNLDEVGKNIKTDIIKVRHVIQEASRLKQEENDQTDIIQPNRMRKTIAKRMTQSTMIPVFTAEISIDMTNCSAMRKRLNSKLSADKDKISYNDIIMKSIAVALDKNPSINYSWSERGIIQNKHVNCGLAVGIQEGLVVPVVKDVQEKNISEISRQNRSNIDRAKNGSLSPDDLSDGTITISNLGMFGIDRFTALLNPPETCILAIGNIKDQPVADNGQITLRPVLIVTATFDHRLIDGAIGAMFLRDLKEILENPELMLLILR